MLCSLLVFESQATSFGDLKSIPRLLSVAGENQLSNIIANDMIQDDLGYMWIATDDGLNRYDGQTNKIYRPKNDSENSLSHYRIMSLLIDHKGVLWVGTQKGLNRYNLERDHFTEFKVNSQFNEPLTNNYIRNIFEDSKSRLWIFTLDGQAFLISENRKTTTKLFVAPATKAKNIYLRDFTEFENYGAIIGSNIGFLILNEKTKTLEKLDITDKSDLSYKLNIRSLKKLSENSLLVGSKIGLFTFDLATKQLVELFNTSLSQKTIENIERLSQNKFILSAANEGLHFIDLNTKTIQHNFASEKKYRLKDNQVNRIYLSNDNLIWLATNQGIQLVNNGKKTFAHFESDTNSCLKGGSIYNITIDSRRNLWISSFGYGLNKISLQNNKCDFYADVSKDDKSSGLKNIVTSYEDKDGAIWFGTYDNGIYYYLPKTQRTYGLKNFIKTKKISLPIDIADISGNQKGLIWFATQFGGIYELNTRLKTIKQFIPSANNELNSLSKSIRDIEYDGEHTLWLATAFSGLWSLDLNNYKFTKHNTNTDKFKIPASLISVVLDSKNNLWIGTKGNGVIKYNIDSSSYYNYTIENGLFSNIVLNTVETPQGEFWFFTDKGLSKLTPRNNKIKTFFEKDGLQADPFTNTGFFDEETNQIFTGGINGFNVFSPSNVDAPSPIRKALITNFQLFYKPVNISNEEKLTPLKANILSTSNLELKSNQNVFSFSFSTPEYLYPERIKYGFKLDGYDKDWNYVSSDRRFANYTNIDPGDYVFKVKASNIDGEWSDNIKSIKINIAYPWWQTNLAYILYVMSAISLIFFITNLRTRTLVERAEELENSINRRTAELADEKAKVEQLLSRKNEEFANVSHEFRTPLTLILGPLAQVIKKINTEEEINRLNIVQRNGYRLLRMVDQLLNLETFRVKSITQKSPQAIGKITKLLTDAFSDLAQEKKVELLIEKQIDINFEFTPDAYEKVLLNLLSNAVKYSKPGDLIRVSTERTQENKFRLEVADTGIGIPEEKLESVFERYNRVLDENSEQVTGAGIGLALVKELVEAHEGKVEIESLLGVGTTINVTLPIIGEVDSIVLDSHANDEIIAMELMSLAEQDSIEEVGQQTQITDDSSKPSVLVIEDNPDMRQYITTSISDDYQVLTANDGEAGLKLAIDEVPDLIISDIMMPKMDGYQTANAIRNNEITSHIPIILLTARGDRESRLKGWYERADEYLTKPFDVEELEIRLQNLLEIRDILKKRFAETAFERTPTIHIEDKQDVESNKNIQQQEFINQLNTYLEDIYTNSELTVPQVAKAIAMSDRQLFRKLKSIVNMSPVEYLRRYRLEKSKQLLLEGKSAGYVAFEVGFSSQSYFGRCFKAQFGMSPKEFKNQVSQQKGG